MDFKKTLMVMEIRIDKLVAESRMNYSGLRQLRRAIGTLEKKLAHVWKPGNMDGEKKVAAVNKSLKTMKLEYVNYERYFDKLMEKYGYLHVIMARENLLGSEGEEDIRGG